MFMLMYLNYIIQKWDLEQSKLSFYKANNNHKDNFQIPSDLIDCTMTARVKYPLHAEKIPPLG